MKRMLKLFKYSTCREDIIGPGSSFSTVLGHMELIWMIREWTVRQRAVGAAVKTMGCIFLSNYSQPYVEICCNTWRQRRSCEVVLASLHKLLFI